MSQIAKLKLIAITIPYTDVMKQIRNYGFCSIIGIEQGMSVYKFTVLFVQIKQGVIESLPYYIEQNFD